MANALSDNVGGWRARPCREWWRVSLANSHIQIDPHVILSLGWGGVYFLFFIVGSQNLMDNLRVYLLSHGYVYRCLFLLFCIIVIGHVSSAINVDNILQNATYHSNLM